MQIKLNDLIEGLIIIRGLTPDAEIDFAREGIIVDDEDYFITPDADDETKLVQMNWSKTAHGGWAFPARWRADD